MREKKKGRNAGRRMEGRKEWEGWWHDEFGEGHVLLEEVGPQGGHVAKEPLDTMQQPHF